MRSVAYVYGFGLNHALTDLKGEETAVPLFFALESSDLTSVFNEISASNAHGSEKAATALQVQWNFAPKHPPIKQFFRF